MYLSLRALILLLCLLSSAQSHATTVTAWNEALTNIFQAVAPSPARAARDLAMVHTAMADAILLTDGKTTTFWPTSPADAFPNTLRTPSSLPQARDIAAHAAAQTVTTALYPAEIARCPAAPSLPPSLAWAQTIGLATGHRVLEARAEDRAQTTIPYIPSEAPGRWRRTTQNRPPEMPHWSTVTPFCLRSASQFRPPPPPAVGSEKAQSEITLVTTLGAKTSTTRTAAETTSARFWSDFSYTSTPPGHWNAIARDLCHAHDHTLTQSAELFACLNLALADAGIACWDAKYHYDHWRPQTAIRAMGGSLATWESLLPAPSHPDYVSGHSTFSAAAAHVLAHYFPGPDLKFTVRSDTLPSVLKHYTDFQTCVKEIGQSRVLGGIHFPSADQAGQHLGTQVATTVLTTWKAR